MNSLRVLRFTRSGRNHAAQKMGSNPEPPSHPMKTSSCWHAAIGVLSVLLTLSAFGQFASVPLQFSQLVSSADVGPAFQAGDNLMLSSLVTNSTGPLNQTINFKVGT